MQRLSQTRRMASGTRRLPAALLLLLVVVAQISSYAHLVLVPHVLCLEHGDFVESHEQAAPDEAGAAAAASGDASALGTTLSQAPAAPEVGHGHEHCLLASHHRGWVALPEGRCFETEGLARSEPEACGTPANSGPCAIALLRLAPKTSPPV